MMKNARVLKAIADETRLKIVTLLLSHNYCVRALSRKLEISEAGVSQHLKILREAGLLVGEKNGYFMHYDVNRNVLRELAYEIEMLADIERVACSSEHSGYQSSDTSKCPQKTDNGVAEMKAFCYGGGQRTCHCKHHENGAEKK